jgi:hypothetical protein
MNSLIAIAVFILIGGLFIISLSIITKKKPLPKIETEVFCNYCNLKMMKLLVDGGAYEHFFCANCGTHFHHGQYYSASEVYQQLNKNKKK